MLIWEPVYHAALIYRFVRQVFPLVEGELDTWRERARQSPDPALAAQAGAAIATKRFHAQGGSIYALYPFPSGQQIRHFVSLIVALQTISDYLDNLCDRAGVIDEAGFLLLHQSMLDAMNPCSLTAPGLPQVSQILEPGYYSAYPYRDDGGYLQALVQTCRKQVSQLPSYTLISGQVLNLVRLYAEMQSLKHLEPAVREKKLKSWAQPLMEAHPELFWWELAAASGSTLGVFAFLALAADPGLTVAHVNALGRVYFPWVAALHILLDYYIDQDEDRQEGDLNFVSFYRDGAQCTSRIRWLLNRALQEVAHLPDPAFHRAVIQGLLALYLSDHKARCPNRAGATADLLTAGGIEARFLERTCRLLRSRHLI